MYKNKNWKTYLGNFKVALQYLRQLIIAHVQKDYLKNCLGILKVALQYLRQLIIADMQNRKWVKLSWNFRSCLAIFKTT